MRPGISGCAVFALLVGALVALPNAGTAQSLSFGLATVSSGGVAPRSVAAGDFNGDGRPDLAVANTSSNTVSILLGDGSGFTPAPGSPIAVGAGPSAVAVGDSNGDGQADLAVTNTFSNQVSIVLGVGAGGFTPAPGSPVPVGAGPSAVVVGDFNGDGRPDLAVANASSNTLSILLGVVAGGFTPAPGSPIAVGAGPVSIAIGDFDGDGRLDLAVANSSSDDVSILLGDGTGGFTPHPGSPVPVGDGPVSVAGGDFNGDGRLDLAVANEFGGNVGSLLGDGAGGFTPAPGSPFVAGCLCPAFVAIADFNGDGILDLAVADLGNDSVSILLGDGTGSFAAAIGSPFPGGSFPTGLAIADYDGDGKPDVAVANESTDSVSILLNTTCCFLTVSRAGGGTGTVTSSPARVACGTACSRAFDPSAPVTLTATADPGSRFAGWRGGGCSGSGPCTLTLTADAAVTATFSLPALSATAGTAQRTPVFTRFPRALEVTLADEAGAPTPGVLVTFSAPGSGPSAGFPAGPTAVTDAAGRARVPVVANGIPGAYAVTATVPGATASFALLNTGRFVAVGADAGSFPEVKLYDALTGRLLHHFLAYPPGFGGGVRVALGDLTGDGVPEVITAPGPGSPPLVKVFDGASGVELGGVLAYDSAFQGGVFVATGDINGDGRADLVTGAGPGGPPHVKVFSGAGGALLASFFAFDPGFQGGVRVAVSDVTGDGVVDLLTVAGPGAPALVRVFATSAGGEAARGFVFDLTFTGGAFVGRPVSRARRVVVRPREAMPRGSFTAGSSSAASDRRSGREKKSPSG